MEVTNNLIALDKQNKQETHYEIQNNKFIIQIQKFLAFLFLFVLILAPYLGMKLISFSLDTDIENEVFIFLLIFDLMLILVCLHTFEKQMELTKDISNDKFNLKRLNYLCCSTLEIHCDLENILFYWSEDKLFVINTLQNLSKININLSSIKNKAPIFLFRFFDDIDTGKFGGIDLEKNLNYFFGVSQNIYNPLKFNVDEYMYKRIIKSDNITISHEDIKFHQIMKFSDYFFTFFLEDYLKTKNHKRIDFIYSNNFDTIFIEKVRDNCYSYIYEFKMSTIEKFVLKKNFEGYDLNIIFKDNYENKEKTICPLYFTKYALKGLIYLLNEKILNVNNDNIDQFFEE